MSVSYVGGQGVLVTMLDSSVDRHGVISILLTDTELLPAGIDGHGVVVDGNGTLSKMLLSTVD